MVRLRVKEKGSLGVGTRTGGRVDSKEDRRVKVEKVIGEKEEA